MMEWYLLDEKIKGWLAEDLPYGDVTSDPLFSDEHICSGTFVAKEDGCIAGLMVAERVFRVLSEDVVMTILVEEGSLVKKGTAIAKISGLTRDILKGERLALNLMQRISGIATMTRKYADRLEGTHTRIVDTRKTTPGLRELEKYAVRMGGGYNHRFNLSDGVMLKDNHIEAAGGITNAVTKVRATLSHMTKIEVEVEDLFQFEEAMAAGAEVILLDNMDTETMAKAVAMKRGNVILEASGNITLERIEEIAATGVDIISSGALTHSVKSLDISLDLHQA
jgi:nicotinate-nucleotide pyrophosphorylase (carboxylating)